MPRNSSTSNSRRKARRWALLLGLVLLGLLLADAALLLYARHRISPNSYVEDAPSKAEHMRLRLGGKRPDIVFVGSSRTLHHISSAVFEQAGWTVYNYGISGHQIVNYPFMAGAAADLKPTYVALGVTISAFANPDIAVPSRPTLADLKALYATGQPLGLLAATTGKWLANLHLLNYYSQVVNLRLRPLFERLDVPLAPEPRRPAKPVGQGERHAAPAPGDAAPGAAAGAPPAQAAPMPAPGDPCDCTPFEMLTDKAGMRIVKCTNGDAVLFGSFWVDGKDRSFTWKGFHEPYLALLNHCLDLIRARGARPVVILEPFHRLRGDYDLAAIRKAVRAPVLDFTRFPLPDALWADPGHLNNAGRLVFSRALAEAFAALPR